MGHWIEEQGVVLSAEAHSARVRIERQSTCGSCSARTGCGSGVLSEVLGRKAVEVTIGHPGQLRAGDRVIIGIRDQALVSGALTMYLLPLLGLVAVPGLLMWGWPTLGEGWLMLAGAAGFGLGLGGVRYWMRHRAPDLAPVFLRREPTVGAVSARARPRPIE